MSKGNDFDIDRLPKDGNICLIDADSLIYYEMDNETYEEAVSGLDQRIQHSMGFGAFVF